MDTNQHPLCGKRVLVSGATGFVGSHLLPLLLQTGAEVFAFCRASSDTSRLPAGTKILVGDFSDPKSVETALRGKDVFIHMAALLFGLGWQDYLKGNCNAAQSIAKAIKKADEAGPSKIVLLSSLSASGPCATPPGRGDDSPGAPVSAYGWSKLLSESILRGAADKRLISLRAPIIYGSGDLGLLPVYKGLRLGIGVTPGLGRDFPISVIHADDICKAIILAASTPQARGVYHLSDGKVYSMKAFYQSAAKALGKQAFILPLPLWLMKLTAACSTCMGKILKGFGAKRAPNWNIDKYREARGEGWLADSSRIRDELGFTPSVSLETGMEETITGNRRLGLL